MKKILVVFLALLISGGAKGVDVQKLIRETQTVAQGPKEFTLIWWIPPEFWETILRENSRVTPEQRAEFAKILDNYIVYAVVSADVGAFGGITPRSRDLVVQNTELKVGDSIVPPLNRTEISSDAQNFVDMMRPMMANMLGKFGQGIEFMLYPNPPSGGERVSASKAGFLSYTAFGHRLALKLPLTCLLPPKIDPGTGQEFPGDYLFNPYSGEKLTEAVSAQPSPPTPGGLPPAADKPVAPSAAAAHP